MSGAGMASDDGSQTGIFPSRSARSMSCIDRAGASLSSRSRMTWPNWSMARIAMAWAALSEKPMRFCASRTWSANGPPPGTMTSGSARARQRGDPLAQHGLVGRAAAELDDGSPHEVRPFLPRPGNAFVFAGQTRLADACCFGRLRSISTPTPPGPSSSFSTLTVTRMTRGFSSTCAATCSASVSLSWTWPARDDGADAVHDDVVGEHVAHVLRAGP